MSPDDDARARVLADRLRAAGCVFAEEEAELLLGAAPDGAALEGMTARRTGGEPLETVLGWVAFAGRRVGVGPGVFVPRRRTELLARTAAQRASAVAATGRTPVVVELCCGAGAVATVVAQDVPCAVVHAADVDPAAVVWAAHNLADLGTTSVGDLGDAVPDALRGTVDVLVANAPYVPSGAVATMPVESREHEPLVAVDGGADGLDVQRRLLAQAPGLVRPGGCVAVETSVTQAPGTAAACPAGWAVQVLRDEDVEGTVVVAVRPA